MVTIRVVYGIGIDMVMRFIIESHEVCSIAWDEQWL